MTTFSTYGNYFRSLSIYQDTFKHVFSLSPYSYSVNMGVYYYDKYRAVSISVLGMPSLVLDNDMYGYSPDFYFNSPSFKTLFPIQLSFNTYSYLKFKFVLPFKFYRNYSEFITVFTRLNFTAINFSSYLINPIQFYVPSNFDYRYILRAYKVFQRKYFSKQSKSRKLVFTRRLSKYVRFFKRINVLKPFIFRIFKNPLLLSFVKSKSKTPFSFFVLKFNNLSCFDTFFVNNRAFCLSQFIVPLIQRFIKFIFKIDRKLPVSGFFNFYTQARNAVFFKFFKIIKKFINKFFYNFKKFNSQSQNFFATSVTQYFAFVYSRILPIKAFFTIFIFAILKLSFFRFTFVKSLYLGYTIFQLSRTLNWLKISLVLPVKHTNFLVIFNSGKFRTFFRSLFLSQKQVFGFNSVKFLVSGVYFYFFPLLFEKQQRAIFSFYRFFFDKLIRTWSIFSFPRFFTTGIITFFSEIDSADYVLPYSTRLNFFKSGSFSSNYQLVVPYFSEFYFARYFSQNLYLYNMTRIKINFSKKKKSQKHGKQIFRFYF